MLPLPPVNPSIGLYRRIRLARDYYVRMDSVDYSLDPRVIGRFVDVAASQNEVVVTCGGQVVASHRRSWGETCRGHRSGSRPGGRAVAATVHRRPSPSRRANRRIIFARRWLGPRFGAPGHAARGKGEYISCLACCVGGSCGANALRCRAALLMAAVLACMVAVCGSKVRGCHGSCQRLW